MSKLKRLVIASVTALVVIACESNGGPYVPATNKGVPFVPKGGVPEQISLLIHTLGLRVGQQNELVTSGATPISWLSDNTRIATVSSSGTVSGVAPGTAHVIAAAQSNADTALVTVVSAVASVQLVSHSVNVAAGQSTQLTFAALDSTGKPATAWNVRWSSTVPQTVFVDQSGSLSALVLGQATVTVTADGKSDSALVTVVPVPIATIQLSAPKSLSLDVGTTYTLSATPRDAAGNILFSRAFVWASGSSAVATVSQTGLVTAISGGTATITATSEGKSASASVVVLPVSTVGVALGSSTIKIGQVVQATAAASDVNGTAILGRQATWSSQNANVATVSSLGAVQGVAGGTAQIVATVDGVTGSATVNVLTPPPVGSSVASVSVAVTPSALSGAGQTGQATATPHDSLGNAVTGLTPTWTSSNTGVATVSSSGLVTAVANGSASISAVVQGKSGSAPVTVATPAPPSPGHPNEPAGMRMIASNTFDAVLPTGWWAPYGTTNLTVANDPTSPASPPNVLKVTYAAGLNYQGSPGTLNLTEEPLGMAPTQLYISYWWKLDPGFQGNNSGNGDYKNFYTTFTNNDWYTAYPPGQNVQYAGVNGLHSSITGNQSTAWFIPAGTTDPVQKVWNPAANAGAGGYMVLDGTLPNGGGQANLWPNVAPYVVGDPDAPSAGPQLNRGQWHHTEMLYALNTDGHVDGVIKEWVDGTLIENYALEWSTLMGRYYSLWFDPQVPLGHSYTVPTSYYAYYDDFYFSGGYARPGEQPDHYVLTPSTTAPAPGAIVTISLQLVDANGNPCRATAQHISGTATAGTLAFPGTYQSTAHDGSFVYTLAMPNSHGASATVNVTDTGSPARTGSLTLTTTP